MDATCGAYVAAENKTASSRKTSKTVAENKNNMVDLTTTNSMYGQNHFPAVACI